jgi:hypothetical protein
MVGICASYYTYEGSLGGGRRLYIVSLLSEAKYRDYIYNKAQIAQIPRGLHSRSQNGWL